MRQLQTAHISLEIGDDAAELLLEYAALLATAGRGDVVELHGFDAHGKTVDMSLLLNGASVLSTTTSASSALEPDNRHTVEYLHSQLASYGVVTTLDRFLDLH
jgi:hypothetical protein